MKKLALGLIVAVPLALLAWTAHLILSAPPADWTQNPTAAQLDAAAAMRDHLYMQAAYTITWAIQLGYLAWLGIKWRAQKHEAERAGRLDHPGKSPSPKSPSR
jgi:threonine/homoserine/homoserine lactone efflux protein